MFEKVNKFHPDKVADRIAGALVDVAYEREENPRIAVEVLAGHGHATVIIETSLTRQDLSSDNVQEVIQRIAPNIPPSNMNIIITPQDHHLASNQSQGIKCGDNGIFKGCPVTEEQRVLAEIADKMADVFVSDGKYIIDGQHIIVCQSNADELAIRTVLPKGYAYTINPLGTWTGGLDADSGATNRKLGSDMGDAVTGGGLHGKDLSKADVSVNVMCHLYAQQYKQKVYARCAIGDSKVSFYFEDGRHFNIPYVGIVSDARRYIETKYGSFERFAEYGLIY